MARLYSKRKGKSKSRKPLMSEANVEVDMKKIDAPVAAYIKQGMNSAMIGQNLKDKHNVGYIKAAFGMRLGQYLAEKGVKKEMPDDLVALMRKAVIIRKHLTANHRDVYGKVRLHRVESKIWRLSKYYIQSGKLPASWKYDPEQAALMIKKA